VFLRLSARRARLYGMDAPTQIALSVNIKAEMEAALDDLERVVLGEVIRSDVLDDEPAEVSADDGRPALESG
jgi:hypothetical protein